MSYPKKLQVRLEWSESNNAFVHFSTAWNNNNTTYITKEICLKIKHLNSSALKWMVLAKYFLIVHSKLYYLYNTYCSSSRKL